MVAPARAPLRIDRLRAVNAPKPVVLELDASGVLSVSKVGKIEAILETWRIDDEWWRLPIVRRYVEVILEGGGRVVLFEDMSTGEWWMQKPA